MFDRKLEEEYDQQIILRNKLLEVKKYLCDSKCCKDAHFHWRTWWSYAILLLCGLSPDCVKLTVEIRRMHWKRMKLGRPINIILWVLLMSYWMCPLLQSIRVHLDNDFVLGTLFYLFLITSVAETIFRLCWYLAIPICILDAVKDQNRIK